MRRIVTTTLRAVQGSNKGLYGCVRMQAKKGVYNVYGICGRFFISQDNTEVCFPHTPEHLFFYGQEGDFQKNFRRRAEVLRIAQTLFQQHLDAEYEPSTSPQDRRGIGHAAIPVLEIGLKPGQLELLAAVSKDVEQQLPGLLQQLISVDVPPEGTKPYAAMVGNFKRFPKELLVLAEKQGRYFKTRETKEESALPVVHRQRPRVWSSPTGGLPEWAKDYMRRHRK